MDLGQFGIWTTYRRIGEDRAGEAARLAEELGYSVFWLGGSPRLPSVRPLLEATQGLVIATSIVNIWAYDPARARQRVRGARARLSGALARGHRGRPSRGDERLFEAALGDAQRSWTVSTPRSHRSRATAGASRHWRRRCSL